MEAIIEIAKEINVGQLIAIGIMFWFFYTRLNGKIEKLSCKIEDIDRRLCRIEGSLSTQGHCLFIKSQSDQKAG